MLTIKSEKHYFAGTKKQLRCSGKVESQYNMMNTYYFDECLKENVYSNSIVSNF